MICISIAQESRRFALVDMHNSAKQCDLLEVQLDRFSKAPDVKELLANKPKPIILSCRRPADGGQWSGTEEERLALLRQCIVSKADYVEIELDAADQIRKFPPAKRVISYTNLQETPANIGEIYAEALKKSPDIIKLVTVAKTPEEAWPLMQILSKPKVPTVVVGLGKPGLMLTVLGKRIGAPFTYAALEKGMEAYPEQPTVRELRDVYCYDDIGKTTRLIAVTGFTDREYVIAGVLNRGFKNLDLNMRCLPVQVGNINLFSKVMDIVKMKAVVTSEPWRKDMLKVANELEPAAEQAQALDLLVHEDKVWTGYNLLWRSAGAALESTLRGKYPSDKPLENKVVMIVGADATARSLALGVSSRGAIPIVASRDRDNAHKLAKEIGCRFIGFEAIYSTAHNVLIVCTPEEYDPMQGRSLRTQIHPGYLKPSIAVMDFTNMPKLSELQLEAKKRGCEVVTPRRVMLEQILLTLRLITDKDVTRETLEQAMSELTPEENE